MIPAPLKRAIKSQLASPVAWPLVARWLPPAAVVLAYHRVSVPDDPFRHVDVDSFRAQMEWLRRHCTIIGPGDLRAAVDRDPAPPRTPVLASLDIPAVNFVATQFIDDGTLFWWDVVELACRHTPLAQVTLPWTSQPLDAGTPAARMRLYRECQRHLKGLPDADKRTTIPMLLESLRQSVEALRIPRQVMTWDEIRETMPLTTYGGHLHSHPLVSRIDAGRLDDELVVSHERMRQEIGRRPTLFAYPDGDITESAKTALRRHEYDIAFGITAGFVTRGADWMALQRIPGPQSVADLAWRIAGLLRRRGTR
jgi:peptidoglycan/xylan/chitin deacetylase (PgdA/CDA1 family)